VHKGVVKMAGFRNIIVHDYARIEPEIVIVILKRDIADLKRFGREIIQYLDAQNP
jgi:uncharacterized protein YutE (UPF0331/DUF86 family)